MLHAAAWQRQSPEESPPLQPQQQPTQQPPASRGFQTALQKLEADVAVKGQQPGGRSLFHSSMTAQVCDACAFVYCIGAYVGSSPSLQRGSLQAQPSSHHPAHVRLRAAACSLHGKRPLFMGRGKLCVKPLPHGACPAPLPAGAEKFSLKATHAISCVCVCAFLRFGQCMQAPPAPLHRALCVPPGPHV